MKTDRNTNCFKYITVYKTSCSWYTGLWVGDGGKGGADEEEVALSRRELKNHGSEEGMVRGKKKNQLSCRKFQSLRNKTWRKEVCGPRRGILPGYMIVAQTHIGNWQMSQSYEWNFRLFSRGNQKPWRQQLPLGVYWAHFLYEPCKHTHPYLCFF